VWPAPISHHRLGPDPLPCCAGVPLVAVLAQAQGGGQTTGEVLFWCGAALVVVVGSAMIGRWAVRRLRQPDEPYSGPIGGFDLADLQRLRDQGHLTDEEHQRARTAVLARHRLADRLDAADVAQGLPPPSDGSGSTARDQDAQTPADNASDAPDQRKDADS
jgi:hypothetical protein